MKREYFITYRNQGKPERTPIMPDTEDYANSSHNVKMLKLQGATSIRVNRIRGNSTEIPLNEGSGISLGGISEDLV